MSGESGAGKTEVNKQCMNYLVWRACDASYDLANRILESNPVLEGLGNAKTVRNNNSSRFGKFVTMRFDGMDTVNPKLIGAEIQTFLLEKSRVVATTAKGERNYHVFYHMMSGASDAFRSKYGLKASNKDYQYISGEAKSDGIDDVALWADVQRQFEMIGLSSTMEAAVLDVPVAGFVPSQPTVGGIRTIAADRWRDSYHRSRPLAGFVPARPTSNIWPRASIGLRAARAFGSTLLAYITTPDAPWGSVCLSPTCGSCSSGCSTWATLNSSQKASACLPTWAPTLAPTWALGRPRPSRC